MEAGRMGIKQQRFVVVCNSTRIESGVVIPLLQVSQPRVGLRGHSLSMVSDTCDRSEICWRIKNASAVACALFDLGDICRFAQFRNLENERLRFQIPNLQLIKARITESPQAILQDGLQSAF